MELSDLDQAAIRLNNATLQAASVRRGVDTGVLTAADLREADRARWDALVAHNKLLRAAVEAINVKA